MVAPNLPPYVVQDLCSTDLYSTDPTQETCPAVDTAVDTDHELNNLPVGLYVPLEDDVQDLYSTDPTHDT